MNIELIMVNIEINIFFFIFHNFGLFTIGTMHNWFRVSGLMFHVINLHCVFFCSPVYCPVSAQWSDLGAPFYKILSLFVKALFC